MGLAIFEPLIPFQIHAMDCQMASRMVADPYAAAGYQIRIVDFYGRAPFLSRDAFADYVGRSRELGFEELIFYWPFDPNTRKRSPAHERGLERIAAEVIPGPR